MRLPLYQIDAFTSRLFGGNPAAVCPLEAWLDDATLQAIALENNLSETAFLVPEGDGYRLRWFTPALEVDLCGHATLAAAFVVFETLRPGSDEVAFETRSGGLTVRRDRDLLTMDFPAWPAREVQAGEVQEALVRGLGVRPAAVYTTRDLMAVLETEAQVRTLRPDQTALAAIDALGIIATAPGEEVDFVSRFFAPRAGIPEDPVTGSAHCTLAPYWAARLGKNRLEARQLSARGGELTCEVRGDRVAISGRCVSYLEGTIQLPG